MLCPSLLFCILFETFNVQGTKKSVSESPGLVYSAVGLVDFTLNLPKGQAKVLGEISVQEIQAS